MNNRPKASKWEPLELVNAKGPLSKMRLHVMIVPVDVGESQFALGDEVCEIISVGYYGQSYSKRLTGSKGFYWKYGTPKDSHRKVIEAAIRNFFEGHNGK